MKRFIISKNKYLNQDISGYYNQDYVGITKDSCEINENLIKGKNIVLVDGIYTENVNSIEDCIQTLLDFGANCVILYVIAKTRS